MSVKIGARGTAVTQVQQKLDEAGAKLDVDGKFGDKTTAAVKEFQKAHGLKADGIVGHDTARALGLSGDVFEPHPGGGRPAPGGGGGRPSPVPPGGGGGGPTPVPGGGRGGGTPPPAPGKLGPPMDPANAPGATPLQKATALMTDQKQRLAFFHDRGLAVPPEETARAQKILEITGNVTPLLDQDSLDFANARQGLQAELNRK